MVGMAKIMSALETVVAENPHQILLNYANLCALMELILMIQYAWIPVQALNIKISKQEHALILALPVCSPIQLQIDVWDTAQQDGLGNNLVLELANVLNK
jgi:hypothetical protein